MSWIKEDNRTWLQKQCARVLKSGPIPNHVAFIMDGNRRFAKKNSMDRAQGHLMGFDKLSQTLEWCLDLGITEVTVYAFSIENFKRSKEEVDGLMELARQKFMRLMEDKEMINKHGVCIRVLGNLSLLPIDIQQSIAEAVNYSKQNARATLNVCFSYTSRDEICASMREIAEGVQLHMIRETDIDQNMMSRCMYTMKSPDPDLLIRTSGEVRLSDFLLWQSSFSVLSFMKVLWPEFSVWHLYAGVLHYQRNYQSIKEAKEYNQSEQERQQKELDCECVMKEIELEKSKGTDTDCTSICQRLCNYEAGRKNRVNNFLAHVEAKRESYFEELSQSQNSGSKFRIG